MPISPNPNVEGTNTPHYVSERKKRGKAEVKLQPPLTPMIDVTFQLLLYFLLTSTFREDEGQIPGTLPAVGMKAQNSVKLKPLKIRLVALGNFNEQIQYEVSGMPATNSPSQLYRMLEDRKQVTGDEVPIIIEPQSNARWKYVVEVFNQTIRAKFKKVAFAPMD